MWVRRKEIKKNWKKKTPKTMSTIVGAALLHVIVITASAVMKCTVLITSFVLLCLPAASYLVLKFHVLLSKWSKTICKLDNFIYFLNRFFFFFVRISTLKKSRQVYMHVVTHFKTVVKIRAICFWNIKILISIHLIFLFSFAELQFASA